MGKFNKLLETKKILGLNGDLDDSLKLTTAHTRGKTLFPKRWNKHQDKGEIVEQGSTIKMNKLLDSMKRGSKSGELLFSSSSGYKKSYLNSDSDLIRAKANRVALQFSELYPGDDEREEESDNESDFVAPDSESEDKDLHDLVTIKNKKMNKNTAITKFCNFGKTIFGNKSRRSKFFGTGCFEGSVPYQPGCKNSSKSCQRRTIRKGDSLSATFVPKKAKRPLRCLGTILSMSVSASKKGNCRSRRIPAASICPYHDDSARFWVKTAEGRVLNCKRIVLSNPRKRSAFLLSYSD